MGLRKVLSTVIGVISMVTLLITLVTKSHDPLNRVPRVHVPKRDPLRVTARAL